MADPAVGLVIGAAAAAAKIVKERKNNRESIEQLKSKSKDLAQIIESMHSSIGDRLDIIRPMEDELAVVNDYIYRFENPSAMKQGMKVFATAQIADTIDDHNTDLDEEMSRVQLKLITYLLHLTQDQTRWQQDAMAQQLEAANALSRTMNENMAVLANKLENIETKSLATAIDDAEAALAHTAIDSAVQSLGNVESKLDELIKADKTVDVKLFNDINIRKAIIANVDIKVAASAAKEDVSFKMGNQVKIKESLQVSNVHHTITMNGVTGNVDVNVFNGVECDGDFVLDGFSISIG
jgi:hypothetical protein